MSKPLLRLLQCSDSEVSLAFGFQALDTLTACLGLGPEGSYAGLISGDSGGESVTNVSPAG